MTKTSKTSENTTKKSLVSKKQVIFPNVNPWVITGNVLENSPVSFTGPVPRFDKTLGKFVTSSYTECNMCDIKIGFYSSCPFNTSMGDKLKNAKHNPHCPKHPNNLKPHKE